MKEILHEHNLTREVFDLEIEVKKDGEVFSREKANSLTENFLMMFYMMMGSKRPWEEKDFFYTQMHTTTQEIPDGVGLWSTILSVITTDPVTITIDVNMTGHGIGQGVMIQGVAEPVNLNGIWVQATDDVSGTKIQLTGAALGIVGTSTLVADTAGATLIQFRKDMPSASQDGFPESSSMNKPNIHVGIGAVTTNNLDWGLNNYVFPGAATGQLVHESMIISIPAVAGETSTLTLTRDFTNNSGATLAIKEVGLSLGAFNSSSLGSKNAQMFVARDLSSFTIPTGSTIEVSYRFTTRAVAAGGFLRQFGEMVYRQLAQTSRDAKDIDNADSSAGASGRQFEVAVSGGSSYPDQPINIISDITGQFGGIQIGSGTSNVSFADFSVQTRIPHGDGTDELFSYGSIVDQFLSNSTTNQFDIIALFENISGATVDVNETGLNTLNVSTPVAHCIARHALASAVEVPDGDVLKVTYRFSV
jgi:hypothetical protein